jgi:hypothetical protein
MNEPYLTDAQLEHLTGYIQPKRQARWLSENGIKFYVNRLNRVRVMRDSIGGVKQKAERRTEPDFTKVRRAG